MSYFVYVSNSLLPSLDLEIGRLPDKDSCEWLAVSSGLLLARCVKTNLLSPGWSCNTGRLPPHSHDWYLFRPPSPSSCFWTIENRGGSSFQRLQIFAADLLLPCSLTRKDGQSHIFFSLTRPFLSPRADVVARPLPFREVGSTKVNLTDIGRKIVWGEDATSLEDVSGLPDHVVCHSVCTVPHWSTHCDFCTTPFLDDAVRYPLSSETHCSTHSILHITRQIHSDIVSKLPPNFELLGSSEICPIQGIVSFYEEGKETPAFTHSHRSTLPAEPWARVHIIAFQGHPEWHEG